MNESILKSQAYLDLLAKVADAEQKLKSTFEESEVLKQQKWQRECEYDHATYELKKVALERAILEAEGNEVTIEIQEHYQQAKEKYVQTKQDHEIIKKKKGPKKQRAQWRLKMAQEAVETFIFEHESELIAEKIKLEGKIIAEINKRRRGRCVITGKSDEQKAIENELKEINEALRTICNKTSHLYEKVLTHTVRDARGETFVCKRCGYKYYQANSSSFTDK